MLNKRAVLLGLLMGSILIGGAASTAQAETTPPAFMPQPDNPSIVTENPCPTGRSLPTYIEYDLGASFEGLALTGKYQMCFQMPATSYGGWGGGWGSYGKSAEALVPNTSAEYGECDPVPPPREEKGSTGEPVEPTNTPPAVEDEGCAAPVVVQSWPQCDRGPTAYEHTYPDPDDLFAGSFGQFEEETEVPTGSSAGGETPITLESNPSLPADSFDEGTRIELYTGQTTIVVFSQETSRALRAANALGQLASAPAHHSWGNPQAPSWDCSDDNGWG